MEASSKLHKYGTFCCNEQQPQFVQKRVGNLSNKTISVQFFYEKKSPAKLINLETKALFRCFVHNTTEAMYVQSFFADGIKCCDGRPYTAYPKPALD